MPPMDPAEESAVAASAVERLCGSCLGLCSTGGVGGSGGSWVEVVCALAGRLKTRSAPVKKSPVAMRPVNCAKESLEALM